MPRSIYARATVVPLAESLHERAHFAWDRGHLDEAERLFSFAIERGELAAINSLATLLDDLSRPQEAVRWYRRAVAAGNGMAAWNLAMHYIPLKQQCRYGYWMKKAAAMGYDDAIIEAAKLAADPFYMTRPPLEDRE
jgi:TPR repeat protein